MKILRRTQKRISPWLKISEKTIERRAGSDAELYHSIESFDYVAAIAVTPSGKIPIVRQFRPAVEKYSLEFPAGLVDPGFTPKEACIQELKEEAGVDVLQIDNLGSFCADTGRLTCQSHCFFARVSEAKANLTVEEGLEVRFVSYEELKKLVASGEFCHQPHISLIYLAEARGFKLSN